MNLDKYALLLGPYLL